MSRSNYLKLLYIVLVAYYVQLRLALGHIWHIPKETPAEARSAVDVSSPEDSKTSSRKHSIAPKKEERLEQIL